MRTDPNKKVIRAIQLQEQGKVAEATNLFKQVLAVAPSDWASLFSLGRILLHEGKPDEALKYLNKLVVVNKGYAPGFHLRGTVLEKLGRFEEALSDYDKGLIIEPNDVAALDYRGNLLSKLGRDRDAESNFRRALEINPNDQMVLANLGKLYFGHKRFIDSGLLFERLMRLNPDYQYARGLRVNNKLHLASWNNIENEIAEILAYVRGGKRTCYSLALLSMSDLATDHLKCAQIFSQTCCPVNWSSTWAGGKFHHDRIKIAYVSPDFREHPVAHLIMGVIERHDNSRFETIGVSLGLNDGSALRLRAEAAFDVFVQAESMSNLELINLLRGMEIDIAVDLSGYTSGARTELFASRIAPIQVNFLGYAGTMGADFIDYIIADKHVIPEVDRHAYVEQVAYLPDTYLPTDSGLQIAERCLTREEVGLPAEGFVFCSFNHIFKINPRIFSIWMHLLGTVEDSVLWLAAPNDEAIINLRNEAQIRGVDPKRLIFAERVPLISEHLARYRLADLFLDTFPYNAHTTAADALFAGLPVVTWGGGAFQSRVAGSLLRAIGLPELITESLEQYVRVAAELANDSNRLTAIRAKLATNKATFPLFDTERYCRHLEVAYQEMWERFRSGQSPISFEVAPIA